MSDETVETLTKATKAVVKSKDLQKFLDFLEAFKLDEASHIDGCFKDNKWDIRTAALCAEAYSTAQLLIQSISPVNDKKRPPDTEVPSDP
jgi:hypothetical protein